MPARRISHLDRDSVVAMLRKLVRSRGEGVTRNEFAAHVGVHYMTLEKHCGPWKELRAAAGLKRPCATRPQTVSDQFLIDEFRRITRQLGRPPRPFEFNQASTVRYATLITRFGTAEALHRRVKICDEFEQTFGTLSFPPASLPPGWDDAWLRELWTRLQIRFVMRSSDLRAEFAAAEAAASAPDGSASSGSDQRLLPCDVIFCAEDDWPAAPVPVLVAAELLGERSYRTAVSEP